MIKCAKILLEKRVILKEIKMELENAGKDMRSRCKLRPRCKLTPSEGEGGDWRETSEIVIQWKAGLAKPPGFLEPLNYNGVPCFPGISQL